MQLTYNRKTWQRILIVLSVGRETLQNFMNGIHMLHNFVMKIMLYKLIAKEYFLLKILGESYTTKIWGINIQYRFNPTKYNMNKKHLLLDISKDYYKYSSKNSIGRMDNFSCHRKCHNSSLGFFFVFNLTWVLTN